MKTILLVFSIIFVFTTTAQEPPPPVAPPPVKIEKGIIDFPDVEAQFVGGSKGLQQFIIDNFTYPQEAINNNYEGKVYLSFIVNKKGKVKNIEVEKSAHPLLDEEAKRLISAMPKWTPAEKDGKKIKTRCRLPINFTLN